MDEWEDETAAPSGPSFVEYVWDPLTEVVDGFLVEGEERTLLSESDPRFDCDAAQQVRERGAGF